MRVQILKTFRTGDTTTLQGGFDYELPDEAAKALIAAGLARANPLPQAAAVPSLVELLAGTTPAVATVTPAAAPVAPAPAVTEPPAPAQPA